MVVSFDSVSEVAILSKSDTRYLLIRPASCYEMPTSTSELTRCNVRIAVPVYRRPHDIRLV